MKYLLIVLALIVLIAGCTQATQDNQEDLNQDVITNEALNQDLDSMIIEENNTVDLGSII